MNLTDWIGSVGVFIILLAYILNIYGIIAYNGLAYFVLNIIGSGLACLASILLLYWPFIVLEAAWAFSSLIGLTRFLIISNGRFRTPNQKSVH